MVKPSAEVVTSTFPRSGCSTRRSLERRWAMGSRITGWWRSFCTPQSANIWDMSRLSCLFFCDNIYIYTQIIWYNYILYIYNIYTNIIYYYYYHYYYYLLLYIYRIYPYFCWWIRRDLFQMKPAGDISFCVDKTYFNVYQLCLLENPPSRLSMGYFPIPMVYNGL